MNLKKDIKNGKVKRLRLIESPIRAIKENRYAEIFNTVREIVKYDDEKFYLETKLISRQGLYELKNGGYELTKLVPASNSNKTELLEAYYSVFDYDGRYLIQEVKIPNAANPKDRVQRTVYVVL